MVYITTRLLAVLPTAATVAVHFLISKESARAEKPCFGRETSRTGLALTVTASFLFPLASKWEHGRIETN